MHIRPMQGLYYPSYLAPRLTTTTHLAAAPTGADLGPGVPVDEDGLTRLRHLEELHLTK